MKNNPVGLNSEFVDGVCGITPDGSSVVDGVVVVAVLGINVVEVVGINVVATRLLVGGFKHCLNAASVSENIVFPLGQIMLKHANSVSPCPVIKSYCRSLSMAFANKSAYCASACAFVVAVVNTCSISRHRVRPC